MDGRVAFQTKHFSRDCERRERERERMCVYVLDQRNPAFAALVAGFHHLKLIRLVELCRLFCEGKNEEMLL